MSTVREEFDLMFPGASSEPPMVTACNRASDVKRVADHMTNIWRERPKWWRMRVNVKYGELSKFEIGNVIKVTKDSPGLTDGRFLLILDVSGGAKEGPLNLECWG